MMQVLLPLALFAIQNSLSGPTTRDAEAAFRPLLARFEANGSRGVELRKDLLLFRRTYPGSSWSVRAGGLLKQMPSPLDRLDLGKVPEDELPPNLPKEAVAVLRGHTRSAAALAFHPDGALLASSGWDNTIRLWRWPDGVPREWANLPGSPSGLAFSPDGKTLAGGSRGTSVALWDVTGPKPARKKVLAGHRHRPFALGFSPTGSLLVSGCNDPVVRIWKMAEAEPEAWAVLDEEKSETLGVSALSISADGRLLAAGSFTGERSLRLWKLDAAYLEERELPPAAARLVAFSGANNDLAFAGTDARIHVWDVTGAKPVRRLTLNAHGPAGGVNPVNSLAYSPDGAILASAGKDRKLILWDAASGQKRREWTLPAEAKGLAFASDSRHLATANADGAVWIIRIIPLQKK
jgi:WD40 repeat protein